MTNQTAVEARTTVQNVADYFLFRSKKGTERAITHLKLQKLIYYAQAWFLTNSNGQPLFKSKIEAWIHGPVCPELYNEYRRFGFHEIDPVDSAPVLNSDVIAVLEAVWEVYGSYDGKFLEELTHSETPWIKARSNMPAGAYSNNEISIDDMIEYYSNSH